MPSLWRKFVVAIALAIASQSLQSTPTLAQSEQNETLQTQPKEQPPTTGSAELSSTEPFVYMDVLVTDEDGRVLSGLNKQNFRILDNGVEQQIVTFAPVSEPITVVLLLEFSSASYSYYANKATLWADRFLNHLDAKDWIALATFDLSTKVQVDFTHNRGAVRSELGALTTPLFSEANLFDALIETLDKLDHVRGKKAIVLLATGSNSFSAATFDELMERLRTTDASIFCVGLAEAEAQRYGSSSNYSQARNFLTTFARQTGGMAMFPRFDGELPDIFRTIVGFLRSEYAITFSPSKAQRDGRYHRLRIDVVGSDGKPLKVVNEKGKRRKVEIYAREGYVARLEKRP